MKHLKNEYIELLNLSQLFLLREYSLTDTRMVDPTIRDFFKQSTQNSGTTPDIQKRSQSSIPSLQSAQNKSLAPSSTPSPPPSSPPAIKPIEIELNVKATTQNDSIQLPIESEPPHKISELSAMENKELKKKYFQLEPLPSAPLQENANEWKFYSSLFPEWILSKSIPSDNIAQKKKNAWSRAEEISPVIILSFHDDPQQLAFLKNIAQAISLRLAPAQVISAAHIEKENSWNTIFNASLRLVIAGDYGLYSHPKLMQFHQELPQEGKHFLNKVPLLLLSDLSLYLKEPQLKSFLWRAICNEFATIQMNHPSEKNLHTNSIKI